MSSKNENKENKKYSELETESDTSEDSCEDQHSASKSEGNVPSDVKDRIFLFYPPEFEKIEDEDIGIGKWMLFADRDKEKVDSRWVTLQQLVDNGTLAGIKSSTANLRYESHVGVTMCYTADSKNLANVKKAADEIRRLIHYPSPLYYKTKQSSIQREYLFLGSEQISKFMHTFKGGFYERDRYKRWKSIDVKELENRDNE